MTAPASPAVSTPLLSAGSSSLASRTGPHGLPHVPAARSTLWTSVPSPTIPRRAGTPEQTRIVLLFWVTPFIVLCRASTLAEKLTICSPLQSPLPAKTRTSSRPSFHGHSCRPSTNDYTLSEVDNAAAAPGLKPFHNAIALTSIPRRPRAVVASGIMA